MIELNRQAELTQRVVQDVPGSEITQYGGRMGDDWRGFFTDIGGFLEQAQSIVKSNEVYLTRVGNIVVATGSVKAGEHVDLLVKPICAFTQGSISVDSEGILGSTEDAFFSVVFIAGQLIEKR